MNDEMIIRVPKHLQDEVVSILTTAGLFILNHGNASTLEETETKKSKVLHFPTNNKPNNDGPRAA